MSNDPLDDEAPPDIPDIGSEPEVGEIPALPPGLPPSVPSRSAEPSDAGMDIEVDVDLDEPISEPPVTIEPEVIEEAKPPPPRGRLQTMPATPVARASFPPPPPPSREAESAPHADEHGEHADDLDRPTSPSEPPDALEVEPEVPVPEPPRPLAQPPRVVPLPPRPIPPAPRPLSQPPPRPVSPPRPLVGPAPAPRPETVREDPAPTLMDEEMTPTPRPPAGPPQVVAAVAQVTEPVAIEPVAKDRRASSEPPTEPYNPPPEPEEQPATSYPLPPLHVEPPPLQEEAAPVSLKPMRMIAVIAAEPPRPEPLPPPSPPPPEAAPLAAPGPLELAAEASGELEEGDISFPADESDSEPVAAEDAANQLTEQDIAPDSGERISAEEITPPEGVELGEVRAEAKAVEAKAVVAKPVGAKAADAKAAEARAVDAKAPAPPPPPRREASRAAKPVTPPSVVEAKEAQRTKQRKAWWEELFGEDFARANTKLKTEQIVREADFIEESLGVAKGGVMLDLACGGGQHAVELAMRGYGVVGYDLSLYQLAVAADVAQEAGQKLNLLQGDMREMAFEEMFDGIYCWNTSFGYFEEEKNQAVAGRVFRALRPGGMFLIDIANRDYVVAQQPTQTWFEGDACVCMDDMAVDFITSRLKVKRSLILDDGRTAECAYSIRLYGLHELGKVLHDVGFRVTEASGHPSTPGVFFGASSPRIIILAQRP